MKHIKSLAVSVKDNFAELWLGALLFVGLPLVLAAYTDLRAALALSFVSQAVVLVLFYKASK